MNEADLFLTDPNKLSLSTEILLYIATFLFNMSGLASAERRLKFIMATFGVLANATTGSLEDDVFESESGSNSELISSLSSLD